MKNALDDISHVLEEATRVTRCLALDLRPPALYESDLVAGLKWLANDMKTKFGLAVQVRSCPAAGPRPKEVRVFIFEAIRGLLFNVVKHAGVKKARVALDLDGEKRLQVEVKDLGKGFDPQTKTTAKGFGLFSLRERAESFGCEVKIRSAPGKGTCVTLTFPKQ